MTNEEAEALHQAVTDAAVALMEAVQVRARAYLDHYPEMRRTRRVAMALIGTTDETYADSVTVGYPTPALVGKRVALLSPFACAREQYRYEAQAAIEAADAP